MKHAQPSSSLLDLQLFSIGQINHLPEYLVYLRSFFFARIRKHQTSIGKYLSG